MKLHRITHGLYIESRALAWLVERKWARLWLWCFIAGYVVCVCALVLELVGWLEGR